ncbi:L-fuculokinase [Dissostichus eleginoides]|uniref:L-fuculokinase n=1 Tax=Dissostichus eleginoides TaxID=100907 RepID=A0AAD9FKU4_DISEL|nr:L-fuculokinase [Dissostichus eleginoides]
MDSQKHLPHPTLLCAVLWWPFPLWWWSWCPASCLLHPAFLLLHGLPPRRGRTPLVPLVPAVFFPLSFLSVTCHFSRAHVRGRRPSAVQQLASQPLRGVTVLQQIDEETTCDNNP